MSSGRSDGCSVAPSQTSLASLVLAQWTPEHMAVVGHHGFAPPTLASSVTEECPPRWQQQLLSPHTEGQSPRKVRQMPGQLRITLDPVHHGLGNEFLLPGINNSGLAICFPCPLHFCQKQPLCVQ